MSNSEATIARLQNQVAKLTHDMALLRVENHVLRVKNGQVQQDVMVGGKEGGEDGEDGLGGLASEVRQALLEWGDVAAVLQAVVGRNDGRNDGRNEEQAEQGEQDNRLFVFCHEMMVWSVQRWVGGQRGTDLVLDLPHRLLREVVERDQAWCLKRVDAIVGFMETLAGVYSMRGGLEEIVRLVLDRWVRGASEVGSPASVFLDKFLSSDVIRRTFLMREACRACLRRMELLIRGVLGTGLADGK